jgi:hypothetical protein
LSRRLAAVIAFCTGLASCAGDGVLDTDTGPPPSSPPTLSMLQSSIFTPVCAVPTCHLAPFPQQGMELIPGMTYGYIVNVDSNEVPAYKRVAPGHSESSYLYMKISGDPRIVGDRMPMGGILSDADIEAIRQWIDAGAKDD